MQETMAQRQTQLDRSKAAWTVAPVAGATMCGALALIVYVATLCPTVTNRGDSGELAAASHMLGIGHPSGYPLFMMVGKMFEQLPIGSLIVRFNLVSAVFGALTVAIAFLLTRSFTSDARAATVAALMFGFSPSFWGQAEFAEVYTLNAFFFTSVLYAAVRWRKSRDQRWMFGGALMFGLGLTNHMTIALQTPCLLAFILAERRQAVPHIPLALAFIAAGFALNSYMPIRAAHHPALDGGYLSDSLGFVKMFVGKSYFKDIMDSKPGEILDGILKLALVMVANFQLAIPLGLLGAWLLFRLDRMMTLALLLAFAPMPLFYVLYGQPGVQYFLIPSFLVVALWIGSGWNALVRHLPASVGSGAGMALVATQFMIALPVCDAREDRISAQYAQSILDYVGQNATIIVNDDIIAFPLFYYRYAENRRPDVKVVFDHHGPVWRDTIRTEWNRGPVYTAFWYHSLGEGNTLVADGPVGRVVRMQDLPAATESKIAAVPESDIRYPAGTLRRWGVSETEVAPRHLVTVSMEWNLTARGRVEDYAVVVEAVRRNSTAERGAAMMRMRGRSFRFAEKRQLGEGFADGGRVVDERRDNGERHTVVAHRVLFTIPEDAEPGRYDLRVGLARKEEAKAPTRTVGALNVWSIRSPTYF